MNNYKKDHILFNIYFIYKKGRIILNEEQIKNTICIILIVIGIAIIGIGKFKDSKLSEKFERPNQNVSIYSMDVNMKLAEKGVADIEVNYPTKLSYKTKKEILEKRKRYVDKVFNLPKYKPNEEVFGQIEDNKPWISIDAASCFWKFNMDRDKGPSEESVFLNNPMVLIGAEMPYYGYLYDNNCTTDNYFMPYSVTLDENNNLITVKYNVSNLYKHLSADVQKKYLFVLNALNARDFGYQWGHVFNTSNVKFKEKVITSSSYYFLNYIHVGMSCGINGGCNNGSPFQQELNFKILSVPASIDMALWRNQPETIKANSDIKIRLLFE